MTDLIFYPHFYLANEISWRHHFLYFPKLFRQLPSDRPPRDSKQVKPFVKSMNKNGFVEDIVPPNADEEVTRRFIQTLERAFQQDRALYIKQMGKYGKERTATKTFHLCRMKMWPELTAKAIELGTAVTDNYDEWCFGTRQMVLTLNTCLTIHQQAERQAIRCTDNFNFDNLAELLECLPAGNEEDETIQRAVLEFPYTVPQNLLSMNEDALLQARNRIYPTGSTLIKILMDTVEAINQCTNLKELRGQLDSFNGAITKLNQDIGKIIKAVKSQTYTFYMQYRWYPYSECVLSKGSMEKPLVVKKAALHTYPLSISKEETSHVGNYPGCLISTLEKPVFERGLSQKLIGFLKR